LECEAEEPGLDDSDDEEDGFCIFSITAIIIIIAIIMKNMLLLFAAAPPVVVMPNASASVSKHCVPVHTVLRCSESSISWIPGRWGAFWQMQFIRSSHIVMMPGLAGSESWEAAAKAEPAC